MTFFCPFCTFEAQTKAFAIEHIILQHLTPENVFKFAEFLLKNGKKHKIKCKIKAEIIDRSMKLALD